MSSNKKDAAYYENGSTEVATVSAAALKKLEQRRKLTKSSDQLVICLVGLPGRGKSFISRKLLSFLTWRGQACRIFNVGKYRRQAQADYIANMQDESHQSSDASKTKKRMDIGACDANFFDGNNPHSAAIRQKAADAAMRDMLHWLDNEYDGDESSSDDKLDHHQSYLSASKARITRNRIAIFDATNSTVARRKWVLEECTSPRKRAGKITGVIFVESICDDEELLEENFRFKVQNSPDFEGMTEEEAIADLRQRVQKYEERYETVNDDSQSYIKIFNLSSKLLVNHIYGRMAKVIVPSLMSWNIGSRPIFLCRAGDTKDSNSGDENITKGHKRNTRGDKLGLKGQQFRDALAQFIEKEGYEFAAKRSNALREAFVPTHNQTGTSISGISSASPYDSLRGTDKHLPFACHVMASTMPRAVETATWETLPFDIDVVPNLNPLDKGDYSGMELEEIQEINPEWYAALKEDPFLTRFPGGECYGDLIHRLETCIIDIEQQISMAAIISHVSVLQVLMAYFRRTPISKCTSIEVPMHTVIKYTPVTGGGWLESQHKLLPDEDSFSNSSVDSEETLSERPIWGDHK